MPYLPELSRIFDTTRRLVDPVLREVAGRPPAPLSRVLGYQFGWLDERGRPSAGNGGKGIRPALVLLCAEAAGGAPEEAVRAAAAVELVHNFSLAHDDIMDGDLTRRHRPTLWAAFGVPAATLAGDALLAMAIDVLVASGSPEVGPAVRCLATALVDLLDGQAVDIDFEKRHHVEREEYLAMVRGKTAALIGCACALGAMSARGPSAAVERLHAFGVHLGLAFQLIDDVLGIWGEPAVTGKPVGADLRGRKKTYPVVLALGSDSAAGREFAARYRRAEPLAEPEVAAAIDCLDRIGARERTNDEATAHLDAALRHLTAVAPTGRAAVSLAALARLMTEREQ